MGRESISPGIRMERRRLYKSDGSCRAMVYGKQMRQGKKSEEDVLTQFSLMSFPYRFITSLISFQSITSLFKMCSLFTLAKKAKND
jgi:hypothetical protein